MEFHDFESFAANVGNWELETCLLDSGGFHARVSQYLDPAEGIQIGRARYNGRTRQTGRPPPGTRTFCILGDPDGHMTWRHQKVTGSMIAAFPLGGELEGITPRGFDVTTVSIQDETLRQLAADLGLPLPENLLERHEVLRCDPHVLSRLRQFCRAQFRAQLEAPPQGCARFQTGELLRLLLHAMDPDPVGTHRAGYHRTHRAVRLAEEYIRAHAKEAPSVPDICRYAGVSIRTLQYGFLNTFGQPPKKYTLAIRLNGARRDLYEADPTVRRVVDVANAWGFWHMGQFAADYRRMFLELPSQTLAGLHS